MRLIAVVELVREELHDGEREAVGRGEDVGCGRIISLSNFPRDSRGGGKFGRGGWRRQQRLPKWDMCAPIRSLFRVPRHTDDQKRRYAHRTILPFASWLSVAFVRRTSNDSQPLSCCRSLWTSMFTVKPCVRAHASASIAAGDDSLNVVESTIVGFAEASAAR